MIISGSIPNMINGVSQQPFAMRLASQAEEQINCYSSIVEGLTKRPATQHVAKLFNSLPPEDAFIHIINRDTTERYVVLIYNGTIRVFDLEGTEITVNSPDGMDYLNVGGSNDFRAVTVADFTFILNNRKTAQLSATTAPSRSPEALVSVRQGNYSSTYSVTINGTTVTHTTPELDPPGIQTGNIASAIRDLILNDIPGFTVDRYGSTLHIYRADSDDFTITVNDSMSDTALVLVKDRVQAFTDLPRRAVNGFQVEVTGTPTNRFDTYYVQFDANGGIWREIAKPGRQIELDRETMPHALVREANGEFTFREIEWDDCRAGDDDTVPEPSFTGNRIRDIFFFRNRLGFIADENVIFSRSGEFFNFWRASVTDILPTDPIDVAVSHVKVSILRHAVPFSESLLLFSDQTQFLISNNEALTPATISISQATEFENSPLSRPVGAGRYVYFCTDKGQFTAIREYFTDPSGAVQDANEVTSHAPRYVPRDVYRLAVSTNENVLIALSERKRNEVYVYQYYFAGDEKIQSSWSRWVFPEGDTILNAEFIESSLWLVIQRADGMFLERIDIEPGLRTGDLEFAVLLDRQIRCSDCTKTYDPVTSKTTIQLPYNDSGAYQVVVLGSSGPRPPGFIIDAEFVSANEIEILGDYTATEVVIGRKYEKRYTLSPLLIREEASGGGQVATTDGRIQLRRISVNYADTGYFKVQVTPSRRNTFEYLMTGKTLGAESATLGRTGIETGTFRFPVMANNMNVKIEIINDTPLPSRLLNADWEAQYTTRSTRM